MIMDAIGKGRKKYGLFLNEYDSGDIDITDDYLANDEEPDNKLATLLLYPTEDSLIKLNGEDDEIYLPKEIWTPIGIMIESFNLKTVTEATGKVYWQGWF